MASLCQERRKRRGSSLGLVITGMREERRRGELSWPRELPPPLSSQRGQEYSSPSPSSSPVTTRPGVLPSSPLSPVTTRPREPPPVLPLLSGTTRPRVSSSLLLFLLLVPFAFREVSVLYLELAQPPTPCALGPSDVHPIFHIYLQNSSCGPGYSPHVFSSLLFTRPRVSPPPCRIPHGLGSLPLFSFP